MAKTCPKCGAALRDDGPSLPCDWCSVPAEAARYSGIQSGEQPSEQPSDWRRLVTGAIAWLLGVSALVLLALGQAYSCDPKAWFDCWVPALLRYAAYSLLVIASPFALLWEQWFGTGRRERQRTRSTGAVSPTA